MKFELRNIRFGLHTRETLDYTATLFVDGINAGVVFNDGGGGMTNLWEKDKELCEKARAFALTMPPEKHEDMELPMSLDFWCDLEADRLSFEKDVAKWQKRSIVYKDHGVIKLTSWRGFTIEQMCSSANGAIAVKQTIKNLTGQGCTILNTNIK